MPVRLRITMLFALIVLGILSLVGISVYYFSYTSRIKNISTRLTNRAITTARLLSQSEVFDRALIQKIDSSTNLAMSDKAIQAYDYINQRIYTYTDIANDTLSINKKILDDARINGAVYFTENKKDIIAYHYINNTYRIVMVVGAVDGDGKLKLAQLKLILGLSIIGGLLITIIGGYIFSEKLLKPVRKIADDVNEISAKNLARRIDSGNMDDEWHYLSSTLNRLLDRLQDSFELQQRFIAHASHELSTPLTAISSQLEVSLLRERGAADYKNVMQSIYQDVRHLNKLTQTLLEFAVTSGDAGGISIEKIRIDDILLRIPGELTKINPKYFVVLIFNELPPEEDNLIVWGNEELLFSAIQNIVSNACKYSTDHKARITLKATGQQINITIEDKGVGIPASELSNIFQPFYRINEHTAIKGFGLGLSLTNQIIKMHKGNISVLSEINQGSAFTIKLPIASNLIQRK